MRSFLRQLNQYSFAKRPNNNDSTDFRHPRFVRGRPDLLNQIRRRTPGEPAITANTLIAEVSSDPDDDHGNMNDHPTVKGYAHSGSSAISSKKCRKRAGASVNDNLSEDGSLLRGKGKRIRKSSSAREATVGIDQRPSPLVGVRSSGRVVHKSAKARGGAAVVNEEEPEQVSKDNSGVNIMEVSDQESLEDELDSNSDFQFDEDTSDGIDMHNTKKNAVSVERMEDAIHEVDITTEGVSDKVVHVTSTFTGGARNSGNLELHDFTSFDLGLHGDFVDSLFGSQDKDGHGDDTGGELIVNIKDKVTHGYLEGAATASAIAGAEYLPILYEITAGGFESLPPLHSHWAGTTAGATVSTAAVSDCASCRHHKAAASSLAQAPEADVSLVVK